MASKLLAIEHLRTQTPSEMDPLLCPVPLCPDAFLMRRVGGDILVTDSVIERVGARCFSFGDGITRRSAKLAQRALALALASRGALSECRVASAEFLRPCRVFSKCSSPLGYVGAILKTFIEMRSQSRMMRGRYFFGHGGGKPGGKEGEIKITPETNSLFEAYMSTTKPHPKTSALTKQFAK